MSLCLSCKHSTNFVRASGVRAFYCTEMHNGTPVPGDITTCSEYHKRGTPDKWEMEKTAWTLQTDGKRGLIGFIPPKPRK